MCKVWTLIVVNGIFLVRPSTSQVLVKEIKNGNGKRKMLAPYRPKEVECGNVTLETLVLPHNQLARYIGFPNLQGSPGGCFMAKPGRCSWQPWDWDMAAGHCGASRASGVCPPLHRGRSSDETSNGEAVAGALGWGMTRVTNLGELGRLQKIWKAQFKNAQFESRYDQILYTSLFISLASRVYSLNSLNSVSPAFAADSNKKSEAGPALL